MNCEDIQQLIDLFALGALDDAEAKMVAAHLADCPDCREAAERAELTAAHLPLAVAAASPIRPPADLKARVLASVTEPVAAPVGPVPSAARPAESSRSTLTVPDWLNRRSLAVAAAVLILLGSLGWSVRLSEALDQERSLRDRMADLASQQQEIVIEVVDAPDGERLVLMPTADDSNAYGKVFTRSDLPEVVIMANRLPPLPDGEAYHVWLTVGERNVLAGTLPLSDQGFGMLIHEARVDGPVYDAVQVTRQPAEATQPGGDIVLAWPSNP